MADYRALHEPHAALLRAALEAATPPAASVALDLACGAGDKTPWLVACAAPDAQIVGLDRDRAALSQLTPRTSHLPLLAADAHALPLRSSSLDLIWCVAALSLFHRPERALAEARRALHHGGALVVATAGERWVRLRRWPAALRTLCAAEVHLAAFGFYPADDLGSDVREQLADAGFRDIRLSAYLLDPPGLAPIDALLPLLDWDALRPLAEAGLGPGELNACAAVEPEEPEPLPVFLVATAHAG